jgi:hypothetical protein
MKPFFSGIAALFIVCPVCAVYSQDAGLFSPVNRFGLSYEYSDSLRAAVLSDSSTIFFSRPCDMRFPRLAGPAGNVVFDENGMRAGAAFNAVAGGIAADDDGISFGAINGHLTLASEHLDANIELSVFTAERLAWLASGFPVENDYERFMAGTERPIAGAMDFRFGVKEAYLTGKFKTLDVSAGKMKLRWGPGYKGTLGLSGTNYAPFYFYHINLGLGTFLKLSSFLAGYDDEDRFAGEVSPSDSLIVTANGRNISALPARYGAGQRIDVRLGRHVQLGLYELADFFGSGDLTRFANPLQFYYTVNSASGTNNANIMGGVDINVVFSPWRFYGEVLNDDVTMFEDAGNPDKYAFQVGAQCFPKGYVTQAGIEYTHVTRYTYGHYTMLSRHTLWDEPLGWPWGNDGEWVTGHAVFNLSHRVRSKIEAGLWLKGSGELTDDWYADNMPDLDDAPFWTVSPDRAVTLSVSARYCFKEWLSVDCTLRPMWEGTSSSLALYAYLTLTPCLHRFILRSATENGSFGRQAPREWKAGK